MTRRRLLQCPLPRDTRVSVRFTALIPAFPAACIRIHSSWIFLFFLQQIPNRPELSLGRAHDLQANTLSALFTASLCCWTRRTKPVLQHAWRGNGECKALAGANCACSPSGAATQATIIIASPPQLFRQFLRQDSRLSSTTSRAGDGAARASHASRRTGSTANRREGIPMKISVFRKLSLPVLAALFLCLCVAQALAGAAAFSIQELRQQTPPRLQGAYEAHGRTIIVDCPVDIPDAASFPFLNMCCIRAGMIQTRGARLLHG